MSLVGPDADALALALVASGCMAFVFLLARSDLRLAFLGWLGVVAFVPVWFGIPFIVLWVPATAVGLLLIAAGMPWRLGRTGSMDLFALAFFVACLVPVFIGGEWTRTSLFVAIAQWGLAYFIGRIVPTKLDLAWIYTAVAVVMCSVAVLAVAEFLLHWNPFVELAVPGKDYALWSKLQERGGVIRAEGAFGHSIALGCSLALAVPLALGSSLAMRWRLIATGILLVGTFVTLSRVGIIGALLGAALSLVGLRNDLPRKVRIGLLSVAVAVSVSILPRVLEVFAKAGDEATNSAAYRGKLLDLVPAFPVFGFSESASRSPAGDLRFGAFRSIDSQLILTGLTYGWIVLLLGLTMLAVGAVTILRGTSSPPTIAIVAQVPALGSVALITQYSMFFWFIAGLAVAAASTPLTPDGDGLPAPVLRGRDLLRSGVGWVRQDQSTTNRELARS